MASNYNDTDAVQNALDFKNYLISELKKNHPNVKESSLNKIFVNVDKNTKNLNVFMPTCLLPEAPDNDEGHRTNMNFLNQTVGQFNQVNKKLTRTKYMGHGMTIEDIVTDEDIAGAIYKLKLDGPPLKPLNIPKSSIESPIELSAIESLSLDDSVPSQKIPAKHVKVIPPAPTEKKPSIGYFSVSSQVQCNKPLVKAIFATIVKRSGEMILNKEDMTTFIGMASMILGINIETAKNSDRAKKDEKKRVLEKEDFPSIRAPLAIEVIDEGFANDLYTTMRTHGTHTSHACLPRIDFLGTSQLEAASVGKFDPNEKKPFIIASAGSTIFAGDLEVSPNFKYSADQYNMTQIILPMLKTLICKVKIYANDNQDLNMRLMAPTHIKAMVIKLYDDMAETDVDLHGKNFIASMFECIPKNDLRILEKTICTAAMACRPTEKNKIKTIANLFGVSLPKTLGDVGAHMYDLSGSVDAFYEIARETTYIDKQYTFKGPRPVGLNLNKMTRHAELMNAVRFGLAMMTGGKDNLMYQTMTDFNKPELKKKIFDYFERINIMIKDINKDSSGVIEKILNGVFAKEYAVEYSSYVDTLTNIVRGQPRILPLSQDKKILQRASHIGMKGALAMSSLVLQARTCDEMQCSTLMIEVQDFITQQIRLLYNNMPEDDKTNVDVILGEIGAMAMADFISKSFGEFITGKVTDSREFITTLIMLENSNCLTGSHIEAMKSSLLTFIGSIETMASRDMLKGLRKTEVKNIIGVKIEEMGTSYKTLEASAALALDVFKEQIKELKAAKDAAIKAAIAAN